MLVITIRKLHSDWHVPCMEVGPDEKPESKAAADQEKTEARKAAPKAGSKAAAASSQEKTEASKAAPEASPKAEAAGSQGKKEASKAKRAQLSPEDVQAAFAKVEF